MMHGEICDYMNRLLEAEISQVRANASFMRSIAGLSEDKQEAAILAVCRWAPKHTRKLVRTRRRPYAKPRAMRWTVNTIIAILHAAGVTVVSKPTRLSLKTIQMILSMHDDMGMRPQEIAVKLTQLGIPTGWNRKVWSYTSVANIVANRDRFIARAAATEAAARAQEAS